MKKIILLTILLKTAVCFGQTPKMQFNHCFLVLDSADYSALINSEFIKNEFSGFFTKKSTTSYMSWIGAYIFGDINYLEIFAPSASEHKTGSSAIALSADHIGDLLILQKKFTEDYITKIEIKDRKVSDTLIPWFKALYINDSIFFSKSNIGFWIMEYEKDYFSFNQLKTIGDSVSRIQYLKQHDEKRENKSLVSDKTF